MAKSFGFVASIGADTSALNNAIKEIDKESKQLRSELAQINRALKFDPDNAVLAAQRLEVMGNAAKEAEKKLEILRSQQEKMNKALAANPEWERQYALLKKAIDETKNALKSLEAQQEKTESSFKAGKISEDIYKSFRKDIDQTKEKLKELNKEKDRLEKSFEDGHISSEYYRSFQREIANAENTVKQFTWAQEQANKAQREASKAMDNAGESSLTLGNIIKGSLISDAISKLAGYLKEAVGAFKDFAMEGIELASDLTEVQNVVDVTFGENSAVYDWADTVSENSEKFGLAKLSAEQYAGTMGAILKSSGINDGLEEMSMRIAELAGDMASFYNLNSDTAFEKIRSGISGETEPLKQLGINMSVVNLEAFAMSQGIDKSWKSMSQAEQTLLRYNYLMEQTADAQGDFSRTSDSLANQQRILELNLQNVKAELGEQLLPIMQNFLRDLNENMPEIQEAVGSLASELAPKLSELADKVTDFTTDEGIPALIDALEWLVDNGDTVVQIAGAFAAAWAVDKISGFTGHLAQIPEAAANSLKSLSAIATKLNTSVGTAFSNLGTNASKAMSTVKNAVTGAETASIASFAAIAAAAAVAVASIVKLADELDTIAEGMNNITAENRKSTDNIVSLGDTWSKISDMSGIEKYNEINAFYDDVLKKQEEWNGRYKTTIDELNTLQEKKFKSADETARMKELQAQKDSLDAEYSTLELYRVKAENMLAKYDNETVRRIEEAADSQARARENAGNTNADAISSAWDKIRETTAAKMQELDDQLAAHQIDDSSYWSQRKSYLEAHRDEENQEWWTWYDEVNAHYEKLAETEENAREQALKEDTSAAKKRFDALIEELESEKITREKFNEEYANLAEELAKKRIDISEYAADKIADYDDKVRKENMTAWEKSLKEISDNITKSYENVNKAYEAAKDKYLSSAKLIDQKVTDTTGEDRYILSDFEKQTNDLKQYQRDLEKLRKTGISDELMEEIMGMNYESGDRQGFIKELLRMSDEQRKAYYEDYADYYAEAEKAAKREVQDDLNEADEIAKQGIKDIYGSMPDEAYEQGVRTAQAYIDGINETMSGADAIRAASSDFAAKERNANANANANQEAMLIKSLSAQLSSIISGGGTNQPINIYLDGKKIFEDIIKNYFKKIKLSDGRIG